MRVKKFFTSKICLALLGAVFALFASVSTPLMTPVYAVPESSETSETSETAETSTGTTSEESAEGTSCADQTGALSWVICPSTGVIAKAIDGIYELIRDLLVVTPLSSDDSSPIFLVWEYFRSITNIIFIIFILVVIYSQLTGIGISNYGIKKTLPRIIIAAILVNLSWVICSVAVDLSNIIGASLRGVFTSIQEITIANGTISAAANVSWAELVTILTGVGVGTVAIIGITAAVGDFWMLLPILLGGIIAIVSGLITIAMRQAVVAILIMISPLAFVAYLLPNTEKWFNKWKDLLTRMLVFYPAFSLLFGASQLAGWAIISSATNGFGIILGMAVQIFPLFFSWSLMKMSGTFLSSVNSALRSLGNRPQAALSRYAESRREHTRMNYLANSRSASAHLRRYLDTRTRRRELDTANLKTIVEGKTTLRAQDLIAGGDLNTRAKNYRTSRYTRNAKLAKTTALRLQNSSDNLEHVLSSYSDYHNRKPIDARLAADSATAFRELDRGQKVKDIDHENDINFLTASYLDALARPKNDFLREKYVDSVGDNEKILGMVISQAAKVENQRRMEAGILFAKYGFNKQKHRAFATGYYIDDDGWAADKNFERLKDANGKYLESIPGELLLKDPSKLVLYDTKDDQGVYYDWTDQDGNVIARVYRDNTPYMKEALANQDLPICDPINDIYEILSGIHEGEIVTPQGENHIGLAKYSTTIGRAILSSGYKQNAAYAGAMNAQQVSQRLIHNYTQLAIAKLDSLLKTAKAGSFNTQNGAEVAYLNRLLDPDNWDTIFSELGLIGACNVNGKPIGGEDWVYNEEGEVIPIAVSDEEATYQQRMNKIRRKYLYPMIEKATQMVSKQTQNTADNQKPGAADEWSKFITMIQEKWGKDGLPDPTETNSDLAKKARQLRNKIHTKGGITNETLNIRNAGIAIDEIMVESGYDSDAFANNVMEYLTRQNHIRECNAFSDYYMANPTASVEELYQVLTDEILPYIS